MDSKASDTLTPDSPGLPRHDAGLCSLFHRAIELIGRRWSGAIIEMMRNGVVRFSDLRAAVPGLSDRMLSERLKELEAEGVVRRIVIPEMPVRIEYHLTPKGESLGQVLDSVAAWAHDWLLVNEGSPDEAEVVPDSGEG